MNDYKQSLLNHYYKIVKIYKGSQKDSREERAIFRYRARRLTPNELEKEIHLLEEKITAKQERIYDRVKNRYEIYR